jgi:ATP-dependent DNA helicase RecG
MDRMVALRNLGLLDGEDRMTYAGAWLLARDIRKFTTSAHVSCALFMGTEKVRILDRRDFHGDVPTMIDDAVAWILTKINVEFIIRHVRREERPELPEEALREAVANAVAHRDYRSTANVQVYVFKDRIEIVSPGGLPAGMTEADLGAKSMPRNPLLFGMLYRMDTVENIGSGIKRIRDLCREHGVAEPAIEVSEHWVTVTFPRPAGQSDEGAGTVVRPSTADAGRRMQVSAKEAQEGSREAQDDGREAQDRGREAQDGAKEAQDGGDRTDSNGGRLQDWEIAVLGACVERPATGRELLAASGYSTRTGNFKKGIERHLAMNLLELTIPDKPRSGRQRYRLTAAGRRLLAGLEGVKK